MQSIITPTLERTLLNFASYALIIGRAEYAKSLREALLSPEPQKSEQISILKHSIIEIFQIGDDDSEFRSFVHKYGLSVDSLKEFLNFLGPDSGLRYFAEDEPDVYITVASYMRSKLDEKICDRLILFIKMTFGKKYWEEIEYKEAKSAVINKLLEKINTKSVPLTQYLYENLIKI
ncbi:MAG: hypothetical protein WCJ19_03830 [bacterium]